MFLIIKFRTFFYYPSFNEIFHCKKCYDFVERDQRSNHPYTVIFAFQDFELRVYDASHLKVAAHLDPKPTEHDRFSREHRSTYHTVKVNQGCFIVFDSGLVHAGALYESGSGCCYKIHFYAMPDGYLRSAKPYSTSKKVTWCDSTNCETCLTIKNDKLLNNVLFNGKCFCLYLFFLIPILNIRFFIDLLDFSNALTDLMEPGSFIMGDLQILGWAI